MTSPAPSAPHITVLLLTTHSDHPFMGESFPLKKSIAKPFSLSASLPFSR